MQDLKLTFLTLFASVTFTILILYYVINDDSLKEFHAETPKNCGKYPKDSEIKHDNNFWQLLEFGDKTVRILNAYLDLRMDQNLIKVNVNTQKLTKKKNPIYCQFWYNDLLEPQIVKAVKYTLMWSFGQIYDLELAPYLIHCPFEGETPYSVSLVASPCDFATNLIKVVNNQPKNGIKKKFGICSKQFTYRNPNFIIRFIEWLHLVRILGAEKVHFYINRFHPEFIKVVNYFEEKGFIETKMFREPVGYENLAKDDFQTYYFEQNMLNDCFYRNRNLYEFIVITDFDEVIMPMSKEDLNWSDIIKRMDSQTKPHAFYARNIFYPQTGADPLPDFPKYFYMLQHIQRSKKPSVEMDSAKSFNNPENVLVVHNHLPIDVIGYENLVEIPLKIAQNSHYRFEVEAEFKTTREEKTIWKFKDQLIQAVNETLRELKFDPYKLN